MTNFLACLAAGFFILGLIYRLQHRRMLPRLIWPYFIADILRYRRAPGISRWRWMLVINVAISGCIVGMIATYQIAGVLEWPSHIWHGAQISANWARIWFVWCDHPWHNAVLWLMRWIVFASAMNLLTALMMSWEDCRRELLHAFAVNKFVGSSAKIALYAPWSYVLKTAAPFTIAKVFDVLDALQRSSGVFILGVGNAPPSGIMILASRKGLPEKTFILRALPVAHGRDRFCIGLAPVPVWWNFQRKPHAGIVGPTGDGKSNLARTLCASANIANYDTFNIFVDIEGVDWQLPALPNVLQIADVETMSRCFALIEEERNRRVQLLLQGNSKMGLTDVNELADSSRFTNAVRLPRILIMFDEFAAASDLYGDTAQFKRAMKLFRSFVTRGRKYGISVVAITTRADFDTFKSSRDLFRWLGVGNFRERAGAMVFEQEIHGWNRRGSFRYELEEPYEGLGVAMAPLCNLTGRDSLTEVLSATCRRLSPQTVDLGQWFQREIHRQQDREELEKVTESLVGFINKT